MLLRNRTVMGACSARASKKRSGQVISQVIRPHQTWYQTGVRIWDRFCSRTQQAHGNWLTVLSIMLLYSKATQLSSRQPSASLPASVRVSLNPKLMFLSVLGAEWSWTTRTTLQWCAAETLAPGASGFELGTAAAVCNPTEGPGLLPDL